MPKNNDYVLRNAIVELKLVDEEGLDKADRQRRVAGIFAESQPNRPVVILRPELLDSSARREYYRAMTRPIKTHIEKANKQLKQSAIDLGGDLTRVPSTPVNGHHISLGTIVGTRERLRISAEDRKTHMHIVGNTGSGKSKFLNT